MASPRTAASSGVSPSRSFTPERRITASEKSNETLVMLIVHSIQYPLLRHVAVSEHFRWNNRLIEPEKKISDDPAERRRHEHGNCSYARFTSAHRKMIACFFGNGADLPDVDKDRVNVIAGKLANIFCVFFRLLQVNFCQWCNTRENKSPRVEGGFENGFGVVHGKRKRVTKYGFFRCGWPFNFSQLLSFQ